MMPKFRAWDTAYNKMVHSYLSGQWKLFITFDGMIGGYEDDDKYDDFAIYGNRFIPMQCTGAKDKHKIDIYEGDIVCKEECDPDDPAFGHYGSIGVVKYDPDVMGFIIDSEDAGFYDNMGVNFSFDEIEVIGNVCENRGLIR